MEYHYLLSGLEDLQENQAMSLPYDKLLELMHELMSEKDWQYIELLQRTSDDPAILALMEDDAVKDRFEETQLSEQDFRTQLLYEQGLQCKNKFLRDWFAFNLDMNNVLAAAVCVKHGLDISKVVVGNSEVADELRKSTSMSKNNQLAAMLPDLKEIIAVAEISDLMQREKHIDALRWQWIEDHTIFEFFNLEAVLAYYLKATILHRWDNLSVEEGEKVFRALVADMKQGVKLDA